MVKAMGKKRRGCNLSNTDAAKIKRRLLGDLNGQPSAWGFVCSDPWAIECVKAIESGKAQLKQNLSRELHRTKVYPPGGPQTRMVENSKMVYVPPDITGTPLDEREDNLSFVEGCKLPPSPSAIAIRRIAERRARPDRTQIIE